MEEKMINKKEERRTAIMEAAAEIFSIKGYDATTVSEIVQKAGIAQGTFYLYFPSKEHVKLALHEAIIKEIIAESFIALEKEDDFVIKIEEAIKAAFKVMKKNEKLITFAHLGTSAKECEAADMEMNKKLAGPLSEFLRAGIDSGVYKKLDPVITAYLLIGMIEKLAISALLWEEPGKLDDIVPLIIDFVKSALVKGF